MILDHFQSVQGLLVPLPQTLYAGGQVPDEPEFPYAVVRMTTGDEDATKLCGISDEAVFRVYITSVGLTDIAAVVVADAVRALLLDVKPLVAGRSCTPLRKESSLPVGPDRDVIVPGTDLNPMYAVDTYRFTSHAD